MKKILVTGAAGFVGINLSNYLQSLGHRVVLLDIGDRLDRIDYINTMPNDDAGTPMRLLHCDLTQDTNSIPTDLDAIIHLAALPHVDYSYHFPSIVHQNNVHSTSKLMEFAIQHEIPFIFGSSVEVYGGEQYTPYQESDPYHPVSPYAASKAACEILLKTYIKCFGLQAKIFRLTNLYGPWQAPDRIIPRNICRIHDGLGLDIQSQVIRDFVYIDDAVRAIHLIMEQGSYGEIYNISSENGFSMSQIGSELATISGMIASAQTNYYHEEPTNSRGASLIINSAKLRRELNWTPGVELSEGLSRTFQWYAANLEWSRRFLPEYSIERSGKEFIVDYRRGISQQYSVPVIH